MENRPIAAEIRSKKLGVLIRSACSASDKSLEECAEALKISTERMQAFESGEVSPSLPELEAFAFFMKIHWIISGDVKLPIRFKRIYRSTKESA